MPYRFLALTSLCLLFLTVIAFADDISPQLQRFLDHSWAIYFGKMPREQYDQLDLHAWAGVLGAAFRLQWEKVLDATDSPQKFERKAQLEALWKDLSDHVGNHANKFATIGYNAEQVRTSLSDGFWYRGFDDPEYEIAKLFGVDDPNLVPSLFDTPLPGSQPVNSGGVDTGTSGNDASAGSRPPIDGHWQILSGTCAYSIRGQDPQNLYRYYRYVKVETNGVRRVNFYLYPANAQGREEPHPSLEMLGLEYLDKIIADIKEWCRVSAR